MSQSPTSLINVLGDQKVQHKRNISNRVNKTVVENGYLPMILDEGSELYLDGKNK